MRYITYLNSNLGLERFDKWGKIKWSFTSHDNNSLRMDTGRFESLVASWHFEGMFLAKHSLRRKLGQPSGTFITYTCHQQDPVLTVNWEPKRSPALSCKGHCNPVVLQVCELGRSTHETEANTHIVALGIEFLNTLFIEFWNSKWIWSVLKKQSVPWHVCNNI